MLPQSHNMTFNDIQSKHFSYAFRGSRAVVLKVDGIAPWDDFEGQGGEQGKGAMGEQNNTKGE